MNGTVCLALSERLRALLERADVLLRDDRADDRARDLIRDAVTLARDLENEVPYG